MYHGLGMSISAAVVVLNELENTRSQESIDRCVNHARKFKEKCVENTLLMANGTPVIGHAKGMIHYAWDDRKGGDIAMKAASRTTGVITAALPAAVGGGLLLGPVGAVGAGAMAGMGGGFGMDVTTSFVDSAVHGEVRFSGALASVEKMLTSQDASSCIDGLFGTITTPAGDAVLGATVGVTVASVMEAAAAGSPAGSSAVGRAVSSCDPVSGAPGTGPGHALTEASQVGVLTLADAPGGLSSIARTSVHSAVSLPSTTASTDLC